MLVSVFVVASLTALVVPVVRGAGRPPQQVSGLMAVATRASTPAPLPLRDSIVTLCMRIPADEDYCDRYGMDFAQRARITQAQRAEADEVHRQLTSALPRVEPGKPTCIAVRATDRAVQNPPCVIAFVPPSAEQVRRAVIAAGYKDAVVRTARSDDPAPAGSVLVAVEVGPACVLAYTHRITSQGTVAGRLPSGRCLGP